MRCDQVAQELSAPTGRLDPSAMAGHLAACPRCAAWSEKMENLDRIWEATRPADPPAFAFDRLWSNVNQAIETGSEPDVAADPAPQTIPFDPDRRRVGRWRTVVAVLAPVAAAAILLIALLPGGTPTQPPAGPDLVANTDTETTDAHPESGFDAEGALAVLDAKLGEVTTIHIGEDGVPQIEERPLIPVSDTETIAASFDVLNYVETLSDTQGSL